MLLYVLITVLLLGCLFVLPRVISYHIATNRAKRFPESANLIMGMHYLQWRDSKAIEYWSKIND